MKDFIIKKMSILEFNLRKLGYSVFENENGIIFYKIVEGFCCYIISDKDGEDLLYRKEFGIDKCFHYVDLTPIIEIEDKEEIKECFLMANKVLTNDIKKIAKIIEKREKYGEN